MGFDDLTADCRGLSDRKTHLQRAGLIAITMPVKGHVRLRSENIVDEPLSDEARLRPWRLVTSIPSRCRATLVPPFNAALAGGSTRRERRYLLCTPAALLPTSSCFAWVKEASRRVVRYRSP
jgi:hypothetical protein